MSPRPDHGVRRSRLAERGAVGEVGPDSRNGRRGWLHPDVFVGSALLLFCGLVYWNTTTFREVPAMLSQNVPPTFFPRLVLTVIAAMSLVLVVSGARLEAVRRERVPRRVLVTAAVLITTVVLIPRLGMLSTLSLASIVLPLSWGERSALRITLLAVGLPLSVYLVFVLAFDMRFPRGLLP